jgi:hypothetical protein
MRLWLFMADWILNKEVLPMLPWQLAQYVLNSVAPLLVVVPVPVPAPARAVEIAWMSAALNEESEPMPPVLLAIALWMRAVVAPSLPDEASAPWQPAQSLA